MSSTATILLIDDDQNDIFIMKRALSRAGVRQAVQVVCDGQEAKDYFEGLGKFADRGVHPLPCLVLLDIKMPRVTGLEWLRWLRSLPSFSDTPVCMVTSSDEPGDRNEATSQGIEAYCVKPVSFDDLVKLAGTIRIEAEEHCESAGDPEGKSCPAE